MELIQANFNANKINQDINTVKGQIEALAKYYEKITGKGYKAEMPDLTQLDRPKALYDLQVLLEDVLDHRDALHVSCQNAVDEIEDRNAKAETRISGFKEPKLAPVAVPKKKK